MRQAISTKYYGPTNHKPGRIRAKAQAGTLWVSWDYSLNTWENHAAAARAFAEKYGWGGDWIGGATDDGYCFVVSGKPAFSTVSEG